MTLAGKKPPGLAEILRAHHDEIVIVWARKVKDIPDSQYQIYSLEELARWASQGLEAIIETINTDSKQTIDSYLNEVAIARPQTGFPIYEVTEGLLLSKEAILPIIRSSSDDPTIAFEWVTQLDACLRIVIGRFEHQFSEEMHHQLTREVRQRLVESESLQRTMTALLQEMMLDEVLEIVCSEARRLTDATGSAVLLLEDEGWLQVTISTGDPVSTSDRLPVAKSLAGQVVQTGNPYLINDPTSEIQAYHRNSDLQALLVIPLRVEDTSIGVLDVVNKPGGFTDDDIRIMSLFADQAAIAIVNARLHQQAEKLAVIEERQRLARELHDSVTQSLYSVTLYADATSLALSSGRSDVASENLQELRNMAREAMLDMRLLIFELHPPILEKEGLIAALRTRLESVEARSGIKTEFKVEGERRMPVPIESELFRIAQEALNNAVKHSQANSIKVDIKFSEQSFNMRVWDNGVGFDPEKMAQSGGMGLRGMEERAQRINGFLQVFSAPGEGTALTIAINDN